MTVLTVEDFRQMSHVDPRVTRADKVKVCLKSSHLWPKVHLRSLLVNMRVHLKGDLRTEGISNLLIQIGDGNLHQGDG